MRQTLKVCFQTDNDTASEEGLGLQLGRIAFTCIYFARGVASSGDAL
jgi:hypothetical protein